MSTKEKIEIMKALTSDRNLNIKQFILEYSGTTIIKDSDHLDNSLGDYHNFSKGCLAKLVLDSQKFFWGNSSYAVLFCVFRDFYRYPDNRTMFEKDMLSLPYEIVPTYVCTLGVISSTFSDNPYMKLHIDKWEENGATKRVMILVDKLKMALEASCTE